MKNPKVFIIILNWNGLQDTLECLESVYKLDYRNFRVIVVDNGSTDNSVTVIEENYPQVIMIENKENLGYTGGNNTGMRYAMQNRADYVWLLNNDAVVERDTLSKLISTAESSAEIGLVSPVIYHYYEPEQIEFCGSFLDWAKYGIMYPDDKHLNIDDDFVNGKNVWLWGTALLIKNDVINKIGYLDEKFFAYCEDTDYSIRSIKAGFRNLVQLSARIFHKAPPRRKPYHSYYLARNEYFMWVQNLRGLQKFSFLRKYLAKRISERAYLRHSGDEECADACFDGAWSAMLDVGGRWDRNVRVPYLVKSILSWHPYFWVSLLRGNFSHIISESFRRARIKLTCNSAV